MYVIFVDTAHVIFVDTAHVISDEKDREDYDERGFRPRLPRVQENTGN